MALTKVQAEGINLADTFAFTGTVTGADMALLHTSTVTSNVGEVQIDGLFTSAFKNYKIIGSNVHLETDNRNLNLKFMSGGSLLTGSVHRSSQIKLQSSDSTISGVVEQSDTEFAKCCGQNVGSATGEHTNFEIILYDPLATDNFKAFSAKANTISDITNNILTYTEGFYNNGQSALSGIEIVPSSGNIASGIFKLYGLR